MLSGICPVWGHVTGASCCGPRGPCQSAPIVDNHQPNAANIVTVMWLFVYVCVCLCYFFQSSITLKNRGRQLQLYVMQSHNGSMMMLMKMMMHPFVVAFANTIHKHYVRCYINVYTLKYLFYGFLTHHVVVFIVYTYIHVCVCLLELNL